MDSDNLLILALKQTQSIPQEISTMNQIKPEDFIQAVIKLSLKSAEVKGLSTNNIPKSLSRDLNQKYRECQKLVEFIKSTGYKTPLNLNNLLFPTVKEMNTILEYLVELISKEDNQNETVDYSEKNVSKIKQHKKLSQFIQETWILPELNSNSLLAKSGNSTKRDISKSAVNSSSLLVFDKNILKLMRKKAVGCEFDEGHKKISQAKTQELFENSGNSAIITNEDYNISNDSLRIFSKTKEFTKEHRSVEICLKSIRELDKSTENSQWVELFNNRNKGLSFFNSNRIENRFIQKVQILKEKYVQIQEYYSTSKDNNNKETLTSSNNDNIENNSNMLSSNINTDTKDKEIINEENSSNINNNDSNTNADNNKNNKETKIQTSINNIETTFEKEKSDLMQEINTLNTKLEVLNTNIQSKLEERTRMENTYQEEKEQIKELNNKHKTILITIEAKLEALENLSKLQKNEIKEEEIDKELKTLEQKHSEMIDSWNQYSNQLNYQINEAKTEIDSKKKEYAFKYEKINLLKKEIEDMGNKTNQKQELKNFLQEEFEKIPLEVNRNKYINKINDLSVSLNKEKEQWSSYLSEIKSIEKNLEAKIEVIKKIDNEIEDKMFQDAKSSSTLKDGYSIFINIRNNYNIIQKNMIDLQILKDRVRELENKVDDYRIKLSGYDISQLQEQVDLLKSENNRR